MQKKIIIEGMSCGHCTGRVEKALLELEGVTSVAMDLAEKSATVLFSKTLANELLIATIDDAGYDVIEIIE